MQPPPRSYPHAPFAFRNHQGQAEGQVVSSLTALASISLSSPMAASCGASAIASPAARTCSRSGRIPPSHSAMRGTNEARKLLAAGTDPSQKRKQEKRDAALANAKTFGAIADEVLSNKEASEASSSKMDKNRWLLKDLAPPLANRPITEITAADILHLLKHIENSGRRETARRLRGAIGSVFRYVIVTLRTTNDPTLALQSALLASKVNHHAAITDEKEFGGLARNRRLRRLAQLEGCPPVHRANIRASW